MKFITTVVIASLLLTACSNSDQDPELNTNPSGAKATSTSESPQSLNVSESITVQNAQGETIAQISKERKPVITFHGSTMKTKHGSSGKLKYLDSYGNVVAKIKRKSHEKIKLKTESGTLLWKVKRKPNSIKIANNEEMAPGYKIKDKGEQRAKVVRIKQDGSEEELYQIRIESEKVIFDDSKTTLDIAGANASVAGILSLEDIPMPHRLVIVAELLQ